LRAQAKLSQRITRFSGSPVTREIVSRRIRRIVHTETVRLLKAHTTMAFSVSTVSDLQELPRSDLNPECPFAPVCCALDAVVAGIETRRLSGIVSRPKAA